jgi:hypothetical protein
VPIKNNGAKCTFEQRINFSENKTTKLLPQICQRYQSMDGTRPPAHCVVLVGTIWYFWHIIFFYCLSSFHVCGRQTNKQTHHITKHTHYPAFAGEGKIFGCQCDNTQDFVGGDPKLSTSLAQTTVTGYMHYVHQM